MLVPFETYMRDFEGCLARAVRDGILGRLERVTLKPNVLASLSFGQRMGQYIQSDVPFIIDYYGYMKRSLAQETLILQEQSQSPTPRFTMAIVIHFASLRIEDILACTPREMLPGFVEFKKTILAARKF